MSENIARSPGQLGAIVRRLRKQKRLSQMDLGARAGLHQSAISRIENGETTASLDTVFLIFQALDMELSIQERTAMEASSVADIF